MSNLKSLRIAAIIATAVILMTGHGRASENEGNGVTMEFVQIPVGSFYMGPDRHVQFIKPFYMGKYEVTQAQWKAVMGTTVSQQQKKANSPWSLKGEGPDYPIYYVSLEEAMEFCKRLGNDFRLPNEAEWEYACRAGSQTQFYYGDDPDYSQLDSYAWYYNNSDGQTHPIGQKKPNQWGLYDMHGNISELCSNRFSKNTGTFVPGGGNHVCRGGSWFAEPKRCKSAYRGLGGIRRDYVGFRVIFTGEVDDNKKILEITLPTDAAEVSIDQEQKRKILPRGGMTITGVVRDEAGMPIDGIDMHILPVEDELLRLYPKGRFEAYRFPQSPKARKSGYHFMVRQTQRNLAIITKVDEDVNVFDIKLKPGAILTGKVVDAYGKGIQGTKITTILQGPDWRSILFPTIVEPDVEGKFEISALPLGHKYRVCARAMGYRLKEFEVSSDNPPDNRIDAGPIVLDRGKFTVSGVVV
ncbi:MAG: SUMF1/EgtB/PvdO family nonheme iron enzyme, partial [Phycisphaerales bacterium]